MNALFNYICFPNVLIMQPYFYDLEYFSKSLTLVFSIFSELNSAFESNHQPIPCIISYEIYFNILFVKI